MCRCPYLGAIAGGTWGHNGTGRGQRAAAGTGSRPLSRGRQGPCLGLAHPWGEPCQGMGFTRLWRERELFWGV